MNKNKDIIGCSPMDTQIFNQNLSVETTSAYIVVASLAGDGIRPEMAAIKARWNAGPEALEQSLAELQALNIVERHPGPDGAEDVYMVNPASLWGLKA